MSIGIEGQGPLSSGMLARQCLCPSYLPMEQEKLGQTMNTVYLYPTGLRVSYTGKCQRSAASSRLLSQYHSQSWDVQFSCKDLSLQEEVALVLEWVMSSTLGWVQLCFRLWHRTCVTNGGAWEATALPWQICLLSTELSVWKRCVYKGMIPQE